MKFLVMGASGFLGFHVANRLVKMEQSVTGTFLTNQPSLPIDLFPLDISNADAVDRIVKKIKPDVVINCAVLSSPDACEKNPEAANAVNIQGTKNCLAAAAQYNCRFIYISSDLVFDGQKGDYVESDPPHPLGIYAFTKVTGEIMTIAYEKGLVIRPALIYGFDGVRVGRNFFETMIHKFEKNESVNLFTDQYRTPSQVMNLADAIIELSMMTITGLIHAGGAEKISRYEMGLRACQIFGFDETLAIPTRMADIPLLADRPKDCSLNSSNVQNILQHTKMMGVTEGLKSLYDEFIGTRS